MNYKRNTIYLVLMLVLLSIYSDMLYRYNVPPSFQTLDFYSYPIYIIVILIILLFNIRTKILFWISIMVCLVYVLLTTSIVFNYQLQPIILKF